MLLRKCVTINICCAQVLYGRDGGNSVVSVGDIVSV